MILRILFFPFAVLYRIGTSIRNYLYDKGLKPSVAFDIPVFCVGNLTVGGTGKSPMVEYLVRLLTPKFTVATLSRGYGRTTKGFRIASGNDNAATIGDEPFQFFRKFSSETPVAVGEERALAIPLLLQERQDVNVILLDDGFQHRRVRPSFSILLSDYHRPFYKDYLLPAGRLRESRAGAARADVIVITKCPDELSQSEMDTISSDVKQYSSKPVFFAGLEYSQPVPFASGHRLTGRCVVVTGIAAAGPFIRHVGRTFEIVEHLAFSDHHAYSSADLEKIRTASARHGNVCVLTTEKDMVKLAAPALLAFSEHVPLFYIPVGVRFLQQQSRFDELVLISAGSAI